MVSEYLLAGLSSALYKNTKQVGECFEWVGYRNKLGYGEFFVGPKQYRAHRAAWMVAHGEIPNGLCVCHTCDNPPCVFLGHLFIGTHLDNMRDRAAKKRDAAYVNDYRGELNPRAKLTEELARRVKYGGERICDLSRDLGISYHTLQAIRQGRNWKHL